MSESNQRKIHFRNEEEAKAYARENIGKCDYTHVLATVGEKREPCVVSYHRCAIDDVIDGELYELADKCSKAFGIDADRAIDGDVREFILERLEKYAGLKHIYCN